MPLTGATTRAALAAVGAVGNQIVSMDALAAGADDALRQAPPGLTPAGAASFLATMAQESAYFRTTTEYGSGQRYAPYIGRTFEQVTWESNYRAFGRWCHARRLVADPETFVRNPRSLSDYRWAWLGGVWYFEANGLWRHANAGNHYAVSQGVNRGVGAIGSNKAPLHWTQRNAMYGAFLRAGPGLLPGGPAPAPQQRSKVEPVLENYQVIGSGALELNAPIKGASGLYERAFVSIRSPRGGTADLWWGLSGKGGRGEEHWKPLPAGNRVWKELTGGDVDQATVHYDFGPGNLGVITLELAPK